MAIDKWPGECNEGTELYKDIGKWRSVERWVDTRLEVCQCGIQETCILNMFANMAARLISFMNDDTYGLKWRWTKSDISVRRKLHSTQLYMFGPKSSFPEDPIWTSTYAKWDGQGVGMSCEQRESTFPCLSEKLISHSSIKRERREFSKEKIFKIKWSWNTRWLLLMANAIQNQVTRKFSSNSSSQSCLEL